MDISDEYKALWPRFWKFDDDETEYDPYLTYVDEYDDEYSFVGWLVSPEGRPTPIMQQTYDSWDIVSPAGIYFLPELINEGLAVPAVKA